MGEDHTIYANMLSDGDIRVTIENENNAMVYQEKSHIYAWEYLVDFAKQVLYVDRHIQNELKLKDETL